MITAKWFLGKIYNSCVATTCKTLWASACPRSAPNLCDILCGQRWPDSGVLVASIWLTFPIFTQNFTWNHAWNINISCVGIFICKWNNMRTYLTDSFQFTFGYKNSSWPLTWIWNVYHAVHWLFEPAKYKQANEKSSLLKTTLTHVRVQCRENVVSTCFGGPSF